MKTVSDFFKSELELRKSNNSSYSLRAFARDLGISKSRLSEVMAGKGGLGDEYLFKVIQKLGLEGFEKKLFIILQKKFHGRNKRIRLEGEKEFKEFIASKEYKPLSDDDFKVISEWYHYAILAIMELDDFDGSKEFILNRIELSKDELDSALSRLINLNFISLEEGLFSICISNLTTTHDVPSRALKASHKQTMDHAKKMIDEISVDLRDISSITMAIDLDRLPEAKKRIATFRRELSDYLESSKKNSVYNLNIQLVPVTKGEE